MKKRTKIAGLGLVVLVAVVIGILLLPSSLSPLSLTRGKPKVIDSYVSSCGQHGGVTFVCDSNEKVDKCVIEVDKRCDGSIDQTITLKPGEKKKIFSWFKYKYYSTTYSIVRPATSPQDCVWCGQKCIKKWNMPDACPTIAPPKGYKCTFNRAGGCEKKLKDADGDGVPDYKDECPGTYGEGINGCPVKPPKPKKPVWQGIIDSIINWFKNIGFWK